MAENKFKRYLWLLSTVKTFGPITFDGINYYWRRSSLNDDKEGLPKKTFFNHCTAIRDIFNVEIICDRSNGYKYYIDDTLQSDKWTSAFLNNLVIQAAIEEDPSIKDKVLDVDVQVEPRLPIFVQLIKERVAIRFRFFHDNSYMRTLPGNEDVEDIEMVFSPFYPLGLIQAEKCWFVIGLFARKNGWRRYAIYKVEDVHDITVIPDASIPDYPENFSTKDFLDNFEYPNDTWFDETDLLLVRLNKDFQDKKIPWLTDPTS